MRALRPPAIFWLPALLAALIIGCTCLGISIVPSAISATQSNTIIEGMVDKDVQLDMTGCADAAALSLGTFTPDTPTSTQADCTVTFSSNSGSGTSLLVQENPAAGPGATFKCIGGGCGVATVQDVTAGTTPPAAQSSAFGLTLRSTSGASAVWTSGATPPWYPARDTASTACQTSNTGIGSCSFRFQVYVASAAANPGTYQGQVRFVALAR